MYLILFQEHSSINEVILIKNNIPDIIRAGVLKPGHDIF